MTEAEASPVLVWRSLATCWSGTVMQLAAKAPIRAPRQMRARLNRQYRSGAAAPGRASIHTKVALPVI